MPPPAKLVQHYGGRTDITAHTRPHPDSQLAHCIGFGAYTMLQARYAGESLTIPMAGTGHAASVAASVRYDRSRGLMVAEIATRHRFHMRSVWRILASQNSDNPRQTSLDV